MTDRAKDGKRPHPARLRLVSIVGAVAAAAICYALAHDDVDRLMAAYLIGFLFWWQLTIGCLGLLALFQLVAGRFGRVVLPHVVSGAAMSPVTALAFVPIAMNVHAVFPWAREGAGAVEPHADRRQESSVAEGELPFASPLYAKFEDVSWPTKADYLAKGPFIVRATVYFVIWSAIAWLLGRRTRRMAASVARQRRAGQGLCGAALVIVVLTASLAAIDWGMSLDPHWFSTIYPATFLAGGALSALALSAASLRIAYPNEARVPPADVAHDVGNLLLAFLMIAAYFAFSQFLIIWSGNLPEESAWYLLRLGGGWSHAIVSCALLLYVLPFAWLLSRARKRSARGVALLGACMLAMRSVEVYWTVGPSLYGERLVIEPTAVAATLAIGGVWLFGYLEMLDRWREVTTVEAASSANTRSAGDESA